MSQQSELDTSKEAVVPSQLRSSAAQQSMFIDTNRLRAPESLTQVFGYDNSFEPFTDEEQLVFASAFKDTPKDFVKIASLLPGRAAKDCNRQYYANKSDGRFKTESRKQREYETGEKRLEYDYGASKNAELAEQMEVLKASEDENVIPIDVEIERLKASVGNRGRLYRKAHPLKAQEPIELPRPDLTILRPSFESPFDLTDAQLLRWLRSADVLPLVKQWKEKCLDVQDHYHQIQRMLPTSEHPWIIRAEQIADHADHYGTRPFELHIKNGPAFVLTANYAAKIVNGSAPFFGQFPGFVLGGLEKMAAGVRILLLAYDDLRSSAESFFSVLVRSGLADLVKADVRQAWERKYLFESELEAEEKEKQATRTAAAQSVSLSGDTNDATGTALKVINRPSYKERKERAAVESSFKEEYRKWRLECAKLDEETPGASHLVDIDASRPSKQTQSRGKAPGCDNDTDENQGLRERVSQLEDALAAARSRLDKLQAKLDKSEEARHELASLLQLKQEQLGEVLVNDDGDTESPMQKHLRMLNDQVECERTVVEAQREHIQRLQTQLVPLSSEDNDAEPKPVPVTEYEDVKVYYKDNEEHR